MDEIIKSQLINDSQQADFPEMNIYIKKLWKSRLGTSISLNCIKKLEDILKSKKPKVIFDLGSGVSTVILSKYAQENDCKVFSLEEEEQYIEDIKKKIILGGWKESLRRVNLVLAPDAYSKMPDYLYGEKADLVIWDGPSPRRGIVEGDLAKRDNMFVKRLLFSIITPNTVVIVDDTDHNYLDVAKELAEKNNLELIQYNDNYRDESEYSILYPKA